ncbi:hypothetical protein [Desulfovibrio sp. QI0442]
MAQLPIKTQEAFGGEKKNTFKVLETEKKFCPSWRLLFRQHAGITDMPYPRKTRKSHIFFNNWIITAYYKQVITPKWHCTLIIKTTQRTTNIRVNLMVKK